MSLHCLSNRISGIFQMVFFIVDSLFQWLFDPEGSRLRRSDYMLQRKLKASNGAQ